MPKMRPCQRISAGLMFTILTLSCGWLVQFQPVPLAPPAATAAPRNAPASQVYAQLPLSFEENRGQTDRRVRFLARGAGYALFLTGSEAVLRLGHAATAEAVQPALPQTVNPTAAVLRWRFLGSNPAVAVTGLAETGAHSNYLVGNAARRWHSGVRHFNRVHYRQLYPGIDLVYYGQQAQLEYDFVIAAGADPRRIRLAFTGAQVLRLDAQGDLLVDTAAGTLRQTRPVAYQEIEGVRCPVAAQYHVRQQTVSFRLGEYNRRYPLVIDPALVYATPLGGSGSEQGLAIALGNDGTAYLTGETTSPDFPAPSSAQAAKGANSDAFVLKLNPGGTGIVYATYLGGNGFEAGRGIAVDAAGNAFVTGSTSSTDFPVTANAVKPVLEGLVDGFAAKLNAAGTALAYSTYLGGNERDFGLGIAADAAGNAYIAGMTESNNLPANGVQTARRGHLVYESTNQGASWTPRETGLTGADFRQIVFNPHNANVMYAASSLAIFKSNDGGATWQATARVGTTGFLSTLLLLPHEPNTLLVGTTAGLFRSTNGGGSYEHLSADFNQSIRTLLIDPLTPTTLYAGTASGLFISTNSGETWQQIFNGLGSSAIIKLLAAPNPARTLYAATSRGIWKTSDNSGLNWQLSSNGLSEGGLAQTFALALDPHAPNTLFASVNGTTRIYKTTDGGAHWQASSQGFTVTLNGIAIQPLAQTLAVDPVVPEFVYAGTDHYGIYKSIDGGATWAPSNAGLANFSASDLVFDPRNPARLLAAMRGVTEASLVKLNANGSAVHYLTYLGGSDADEAYSVAIDQAGNAYLAGETDSRDFPTANPLQAALGGPGDAFITKLNPSGTSLLYSTYLGGVGNDRATSLAVNEVGKVFLTGGTQGVNFPLVNARQAAFGGHIYDAFFARLSASGAVLEHSTYLGGNGLDFGYGIALDPSSSAYVTGVTNSINLPFTHTLGDFSPLSGTSEAFVAKYPASTASTGYLIRLGGSGNDQGNGIAVSSNDNIYVTGTTSSLTFPGVNALQPLRGLSDAFAVKLALAPELSLTMTASPNPVVLGNNLTYTLTVTNSGEVKATGVTLTHTAPAGAQPVSTATSQGTCGNAVNGVINCTLGELAVGANAIVTVIIKPPATRSITASATVSSQEPEANRANNTAAVLSEVDFVELSLQHALLVNRAAPGSRLTYLLRVTNHNGSTASNVVVNNTLPAHLSFVSCNSPDGGVCGGTGNARTISFLTLAVGATKTAQLVATVNNNVPAATTIHNPASVASAQVDAILDNNAATASVDVAASPLRVSNNGKLAFNEGFEITTIPITGGAYTRFARPGGTPRWSPDGTLLLYGDSSWYLINADGSNRRPAPFSTNTSAPPAWSPDSQRVAVLRNNGDVLVVKLDGSEETRACNLGSGVNQLEWSPDGSRFAFVQDGDLHVAFTDGTGRLRLTNTAATEQTPRWSPDGRRLLYVYYTQQEPSQLNYAVYRINADGSDPQRMVNLRGYFGTPGWAPDGTKIAFIAGLADAANGSHLYTMNLDGSGLANLTLNHGAGSCDWQPLPTATPLIPAPLPRTYTISGRITTSNNEPVSAILSLSGTSSGSTATYNDGSFNFGNLPEGGNFTLTPGGNRYFTFQPLERSLENLRQHATANFTGANITYSISGLITEPNGAPLADVTVTATPNDPQKPPVTARTNAAGLYTFPALPSGISYLLTPSANYLAAFQPATAFIQLLSRNSAANFTGLRFPPFTIRGKITDTQGAPINLAMLTLSGGSQTLTTFTNTQGDYAFTNLIESVDYTLTPRRPATQFAPIERVLNRPRSDRTVNFTAGANRLVSVSAASYRTDVQAPESILAVFGSGFSTTTQAATTLPLPTTLAGVSVIVQDNEGVERPAPLFFVSPNQINLLLPAGLSLGAAALSVVRDQRITAAGTTTIARFAPAFFSANASGSGVAAAVLAQLTVMGGTMYLPIASFDPQQNRFVPLPIDVSPPFFKTLVLFGTGFRALGVGSATPPPLSLTIGGVAAQPIFIGAQGSLAGLDQLNFQLPSPLAGRGVVDIVLTADGRVANTVQVAIK
jgi:uncharacterized protein (TIGR03437 family)